VGKKTASKNLNLPNLIDKSKKENTHPINEKQISIGAA